MNLAAWPFLLLARPLIVFLSAGAIVLLAVEHGWYERRRERQAGRFESTEMVELWREAVTENSANPAEHVSVRKARSDGRQ
ncbi:MAG TPA: hypothetical protein VEN29_12250 [Casimicrobiaceae bacterium]|nr:hypothetical protein [Casimicrobiaceae bacterium]